ncbi:MAG: stage II sporulation protein P [Clostridia bacterium]|nr:stage II sporulation protein P [Clostridia bacterium]
MFKIAVFNVKDIIKYFVLIILTIATLLGLTKYFNNLKKLDNEVFAKEESIEEDPNNEGLFNYDFTGCIDTTSAIVGSVNNEETPDTPKEGKKLYEEILKSQIGAIENFAPEQEDSATDENSTETSTPQDKEQNEIKEENNDNPLQLAQTGLATEVVTQNPISLNYSAEYGAVKIKNGTSFELNNEIMNPDIKIENKNILIFHTHTCESYTSSEKFSYTPTGNYRTTDLNFTVARVGDELENHLKQYGHNVIHNKTYHDYPSYNGSYTNSLATVEEILKQNPTDIIFDVHRDAIGSRPDYAPCVKIGDDVAAQIMFVIGTNEGGLWHPNWQQNLKFAIKVQQKAEEMYPGLFKPIMLTKYRYNQHAGKYASIIEVGATGNTLEQCNNSMKYLAKVLDEILK